jgi:manganese oxidase
VLRAAAGDCIQVTLHNGLPSSTITGGVASPQQAIPFGCAFKNSLQNPPNCGTTGLPACCTSASSNVSTQVGLRPQLVAFDPAAGGGVNAGLDPIGSSSQGIQTAGPGQKVTYTWYAGNVDARAEREADRYIPIEFGAANLLAPDVMNHYPHALIGGLVIEPSGSSGWEGAGTTAVVKGKDGSQFREFVVFTQDNLAVSGIEAVNYKSEPLDPLLGTVPTARFCSKAACDLYKSTLSGAVAQDAECSLAQADANTLWCATTSGGTTTCAQCSFKPVTPTFTACAGESVRFRVLHPGGFNTAEVFELYGHNWSEAPYVTEYDHCLSPTTHTNLWASQKQGTTNQCGNSAFTLDRLSAAERQENLWDASLNTWQGSRMGHGPSNHLDVLIPQAGGPFRIPGDYLYRTYSAMHFHGGMWGYFRVNQCTAARPDTALSNQLPGSSR